MNFEILAETETPDIQVQHQQPKKVAQQAKQQPPKAFNTQNKEILSSLLALSQQNIKKIFNISEKFEENEKKQEKEKIDNELYEKYSLQLLDLFESGFTNFNQNIQTLTKFNGDLQKTKQNIQNQNTKKMQNYENHVRKVLNDNLTSIQTLLQKLNEKKEVTAKVEKKEKKEIKKVVNEIERSQDAKEARKMNKKEEKMTEKQQKIAEKAAKIAQKIAKNAEKVAKKAEKVVNQSEKQKKEKSEQAVKINSDLTEKINKIYINGPDHFGINSTVQEYNKAGKGNSVGQAIIADLCKEGLVLNTPQNVQKMQKIEVIFNSAQQPQQGENFEVKSSKPKFSVPEYLLDVAEGLPKEELEYNVMFVTKCQKLSQKLAQKGAKNIMSAEDLFVFLENTLQTQKFEAVIDKFAPQQNKQQQQ